MSAPSDPLVSRLRDNARLSIAIEEATIGALLDELERARDKTPVWLISAMRRRIRAHRVGIIKQRAVMGALGIDV